jgi:hypothetical protein
MYITVLDFTEGRVFQYKAQNIYDNDKYPESEQIEDFLVGEGHRMNDCEWMSHMDGEIIEENAEI